jgi:hypothetical protein
MSINTRSSSVFLAILSRSARADKTSLSTWSTMLTRVIAYTL